MTENPNMQNQSEEDSQTARWGSGYTVGLNLVVSVILGGAIGLGLDHLLGTKTNFNADYDCGWFCCWYA